jgi:N-methylhydantoinase B/oxoprolinase/acetone carboxylase alpha subunit
VDRFDVEKLFDASLRRTLKSTKPEILRFILSHERKPKCIDSLTHQIRMLEFSAPRMASKKNVESLIESIAALFGRNSLEEREKQIMSEAEKKRRMHEADVIKDAEQHISELEREATTTTTQHFMKR